MWLSNCLLALCYHLQNWYTTAGTAGLPLSWLAGFTYAFSCSLEHCSSVWLGLSYLQLTGWDAPDGQQKPGTQSPEGGQPVGESSK